MTPPLTAQDLIPLLMKLPREEQMKLARLALRAAGRDAESDAPAWRAVPPGADEFSSDEDPLVWEGGGWDEFQTSR